MFWGIFFGILSILVGVTYYTFPLFFPVLGTVVIIISVVFSLICLAAPKSLSYRLSSIEGAIHSPTASFLGKILGFVLFAILLSLLIGGIFYLGFWADYFLICYVARDNPALYVCILGILMVLPITLMLIFSKSELRIRLTCFLIFFVIDLALFISGLVFMNEIPWDSVYEVPYQLYF